MINHRTREVLSERIRSIPSSGIRKFFDLLAELDQVISLGVGEPDFSTPQHICEAAIGCIERGQTMYTSNHGLLELREALARHLFDLYGIQYDPRTELLITVGASEAVDLAARAILDPGDEVIVPDPGYVSYSPCVVLAGGTVVSIPTYARTGFQVEPADVERSITNRTKAILLGYPNNPTGATLSRERLIEIGRIAADQDIVVISDEIYDRLVYGEPHTCFAALPGVRDRTILIGGFSKSYAMTGWRVGYVAAPSELMAGMVKIHQYTALCASIMGQVAALQALHAGDPDVVRMVGEYDRRRKVIVKGLNDIGLRCFEPRGAFYAFPSVEVTGLSEEEFAEKLLIEEKVAVVPGSAFGECGRGHVRCCYATSLDNIKEALVRMERFVIRHRGNHSGIR